MWNYGQTSPGSAADARPSRNSVQEAREGRLNLCSTRRPVKPRRSGSHWRLALATIHTSYTFQETGPAEGSLIRGSGPLRLQQNSSPPRRSLRLRTQSELAAEERSDYRTVRPTTWPPRGAGRIHVPLGQVHPSTCL